MSNIREVHPQEERLPAGLPFDVVDGAVANIDVYHSHALLWSAAGRVWSAYRPRRSSGRMLHHPCRSPCSPTHRTRRTAGLFVICLPEVRAEHLILDVSWRNTKLDQSTADLLHERNRSAQVIHRIVGQADLR